MSSYGNESEQKRGNEEHSKDSSKENGNDNHDRPKKKKVMIHLTYIQLFNEQTSIL